MRNFHIKSIIFGIGIGIVITSLVSIIYTASIDPLEQLSEKDIDKLCSMYDLIKESDINEEKNNSIFYLEKDNENKTDKNSDNADVDNDEIDNNDKLITDADNNSSSKNNEIKDTDENRIVGNDKEQDNVDDNNTEKDDDKVGTDNEHNDNKSSASGKHVNETSVPEGNSNNENGGNNIEPAKLEPGSEVVITINPGDLPDKIARMLYNKGLIEDMELFNKRIRDLSLTRSVIADRYTIKAGTSVDEIIEMITTKKQ